MHTVTDILKFKPNHNYSVSPDTSVFVAVEMLSSKDVGALMVLEDDRIVGIVSERDCVRKLLRTGKKPKETKVREIMSSKVIAAGPDMKIAEAMQLMIDHGIRHLPVTKDDKLLGIFSMRDMVRVVLAEKDSWIEHLEKYVSTSGGGI